MSHSLQISGHFEYLWVNQSAQLTQLCERWNRQTAVAIDTEFMRSHTYFPQPALLQVYDGDQTALIDPVVLEDLQPLRELMQNPKLEKVLHAGSEDIEVLQHWLGVLPQSIFDTQIAGAYAGFGYSLGYAKLLKEVLDLDVPKSETRSDWLQRPLSGAQIHYAIMDVYHLLQAYQEIMTILTAQNRVAWAREDSQGLIQNYLYNQNPENHYLRLKSAWKLEAQQLAVLKALCTWREKIAMQRDIPRNRVLKEHFLYALAKALPKNKYELRQIEDFPERSLRADADELIGIVESTLESDPNHWPERMPKPLVREGRETLAQLKQIVGEIAAELSLPTELLLRKKDYESIVRSGQTIPQSDVISYKLPNIFQGWRGKVLGEPLLNYLNKNN